MPYSVEVSNIHGKPITTLGPFDNLLSARQAILHHSNTIDLPAEEPFATDLWFIGPAEYYITWAR